MSLEDSGPLLIPERASVEWCDSIETSLELELVRLERRGLAGSETDRMRRRLRLDLERVRAHRKKQRAINAQLALAAALIVILVYAVGCSVRLLFFVNFSFIALLPVN